MSEASKALTVVEKGGEGASPETGRVVAKSHLVNRLNFLNFQDLSILINLRHVSYEDAVYLRARPLPCAGERLDCLWEETSGLEQLLKNYRFNYLLIPDGKKYLLVKSEVARMDAQGIDLILPGNCREYQARKIRRYPGAGIDIQLIQHGALYLGRLDDFTPVALRVSSERDRQPPFQWINPEAPLYMRLFKGGRVLYSGPLQLLSQNSLPAGRSFVLKPQQESIRRFKVKRYRNVRQQLVPSPNVVFDHPLIAKRLNLKLADLSGTGFSVEESEGDSVLLPGMIIPQLRISFAQGFSVPCTAQVVHRSVSGAPGERTVKCGLAILDMDIRDHVKLLSILHQVANRKSYVCTEVDLDDLWDFFFETGFIYPGKYLHFQANKEQIKRTYARLYGENPQIARHFIYLDRGAILGHMAMVRFYRDSWMIHHHAARKTVTIKAGLAVLDQVSHYLNELENFEFAHLKYVYCYYRPDNKFPSRVFGGFARKAADPRVCSQDLFGYWHRSAGEGEAGELPEKWELSESTDFDLSELGSFYRYLSGGLLTKAFDLEPGSVEKDAVAREYRSLGFKKEKYYYSLRKEGSLKAFLMVNCTDAGFNMADLTNCVTLIVLDDALPASLVEVALSRVSSHYEGGEMPVLAYPRSYLEGAGITFEKSYLLWILDLQHSDAYFEYCEGLFRTVKKVG